MENYFDLEIFLFVLGGFLPVIFFVVVKYVKNKREVKTKKEFYTDLIQKATHAKQDLGTLDQYVDKFPKEFEEISFGNEFFKNLLQPLLILNLLTLFVLKENAVIYFLLFNILLSFASEFYFADEWSDKILYRFFLLLLWLSFYFLLIHYHPKGLLPHLVSQSIK